MRGASISRRCGESTDGVPSGIGVAGPIDRTEAKRELILQGLRAFQAGAMESNFVNNDNLTAVPLVEERTCA
jgi:hypothetical protein